MKCRSLLLVLAMLCAPFVGCDSPSSGPEQSKSTVETTDAPFLPITGPTEKEYPNLHHLMQITDKIYSGGEPATDAAFAELEKLGVKTVVCVDGIQPNIEAAKKHGLRYVHIPFGYDGIPSEAGQSLARLVDEAEGPFYIHCHHGKHRGPAAAAIASIASGSADNESALKILKAAGTSPDYAGLFRDVKNYKRPEEGAMLPALVSAAEMESLAAAMAKIDRASDNLKLFSENAWKIPEHHPDLVAKQEAVLLKEGLRESVRLLKETKDQPEEFLKWMEEAEQTATELESALGEENFPLAGEHFSQLQSNCKTCHVKYRD